MKSHIHISLMPTVFLLSLLFAWLTPATAQDEQTAGRYELVVTGTVRDVDSGRKLENVNVSLKGTTIGTVTNADGYYSLKFPRGLEPTLDFFHLGYENCTCTAKENGRGQYVANIDMKATVPELELAIIFGDARRLMEEALQRIPDNYPAAGNLLSAFYRETVQKGRRYISVSEAIMDVYKTSYSRRAINSDMVKLVKARRLLSQKASDTLGVKIVGGPNVALTIDVVKNGGVLFDESTLDFYEFRLLPNEQIDDRVQYVVEFVPRVRVSYALYTGRIYIDKDNLAFTRAEFALDLSDVDKATTVLLYKKPSNLHFLPQEVTFLVTYRNEGGVTRLNYMCNEMRFKCDWKKLTFSSTYTARSELVVVERENHEVEEMDHKDSFRSTEIFYDMVQEYWDVDYWREYNIIEPTESLENAVKRLKRRQ